MAPLLAFNWAELVEQTVAGLSNGSIYATLALALVLIHRATGVINFAQGEMAMFSAYMSWALVTHHGFGFWPRSPSPSSSRSSVGSGSTRR